VWKSLRIGWLMLAFAPLLSTGCMHTRYAESSNLWSTGGGGCSCGAEHHTTSRERHWSGLWFGQPDRVHP